MYHHHQFLIKQKNSTQTQEIQSSKGKKRGQKRHKMYHHRQLLSKKQYQNIKQQSKKKAGKSENVFSYRFLSKKSAPKTHSFHDFTFFFIFFDTSKVIYIMLVIARICHNRHNRRWCTFFELVYFLVQRTPNFGLFGLF